MDCCEKPPFFSHSNPIALYPHPTSITAGLLKRGFSNEETQQILGRNYLRVFEQWWD